MPKRIVTVMPAALSLALLMGTPNSANSRDYEWTTVLDYSNQLTEVDAKSVHKLVSESDVVAFTWKQTDSTSTLQMESTANCRDFELTNVRGSLESKIVNFKKSFSYANDEIYRESQTRFGNFWENNPVGRVIRFACSLEYPEIIEELSSPMVDCKKPSSIIDRMHCVKDKELSGNIELLADWSIALAQACGETDERSREVFIEYITGARACPDLACAKKKVREGLELVGRDLENAANKRLPDGSLRHGICVAPNSVARAIQARKDQALSDAAFIEYKVCIKSAIKRLDDKKSSAEIIVKGAHGTCLKHFQAIIDNRPTYKGSGGDVLYRALEPQLISEVLQNRAGSRSSRK
ncbi:MULTISPECIES: hypothetical protein [unclassified Acidovorax]|uniref:hypothetical protein n=1 Tax=unclassified Acidovorax TaxID=2684926 RepID=UPI000BCAA46C|nr:MULTISPECIES: hypothetical protein [unclassified Acidovorax]OZA56194.1 MAG: hypothetical protein B7X79_11860 [Acidovorax sp. 17-64-282]HQS20579.1 hypothetical protein [Acidovorax defluvii]HQS61950.1 hypothetical protein [Acidovorax defluvii]HQT16213.1 hypothetical protein [Acidovorax defluvii]HQT51274.1 hypothetical protein [Acidovorax defluvii]